MSHTELDDCIDEKCLLEEQLQAAIQRGDTYRARARALRRQAKAWRITYRIMSDISCSVDPGSTRNIKRAMRLP